MKEKRNKEIIQGVDEEASKRRLSQGVKEKRQSEREKTEKSENLFKRLFTENSNDIIKKYEILKN